MPRTERGLDRIIAFSDGVVAIAMTLLVLPLTSIDVEGSDGDLGLVVRENGRLFLAFLLSFLVIGAFWMAHHRVFEGLVGYDSTLQRWNMMWLLVIAFLPFPTYVIGFSDSRGYALLYIGTLLLSSLLLRLMARHLERHPELVRPGGDPREAQLGHNRGILSVVFFGAAFLIALVVPAAGLYALWVLVLLGPASALLARRSQERHAPVGPSA